MSTENKTSTDFLKKFQEIRYDMSKATLEDVQSILDHYDQSSITENGYTRHFEINPLDAACLNARYHELTGQDHPVFLSEQGKKLDEILKSENLQNVNGNFNVYQRLKNNLTGEGPGIAILTEKKEDSFISKFDKIKYDLSSASLEDVTNILNYYDQDSVLLDGSEYHFRPTPLQGASLNARYHELTGQDHPVFSKVQDQYLDEQINQNDNLNVSGNPTIYEQLKNVAIQVVGHNHAVFRMSNILADLPNASLEDVSSLLDHYNINPVVIDGVIHHPFNDPVTANKINQRYHELTGQNHPVFTEQTPKIISDLMEQKDQLLQSGAYNTSHFNHLETIMKQFEPQTGKENSIEQKNTSSKSRVSISKFAQIFENSKGNLKNVFNNLKNIFRDNSRNNDEQIK